MYPDNRDEILKGLSDLASRMEKMLSSSNAEDENQIEPKVLEVRFKLIKQVVFQVDNSLGDFQDLLDTMEYHQDDKYAEAKSLVAHVEDLTTDLVNYLRKHNQY